MVPPARDSITSVLQIGISSALIISVTLVPLFYQYGSNHPQTVASALPVKQTVQFFGVILSITGLFFVPLCIFLLGVDPVTWIFRFLISNINRLYIAGFWVVLLCTTVPLFPLIAKSMGLRNIVARKLYHFLAVAMFLPASIAEVCIYQ